MLSICILFVFHLRSISHLRYHRTVPGATGRCQVPQDGAKYLVPQDGAWCLVPQDGAWYLVPQDGAWYLVVPQDGACYLVPLVFVPYSVGVVGWFLFHVLLGFVEGLCSMF